MDNCTICNSQLSSFGKKRIQNGFICKSCYQKIPEVFHKGIEQYSDLRLKTILDYEEDMKSRKFDVSASYGDLALDELHGLFAIKARVGYDIFNAIDIKEIGLLCTDISANNNDVVKCNVEFRCLLEYPKVEIKEIIKRNVICKSKRTDKTHIEYQLPGDLEVFKIIFNQTINNAVSKYVNKEIGDESITKHDLEIIKAKALFMIDDYYDEEMLKSQRDKLLKTFHPDNFGDDYYTTRIIKAYEFLLEEVKGEVH